MGSYQEISSIKQCAFCIHFLETPFTHKLCVCTSTGVTHLRAAPLTLQAAGVQPWKSITAVRNTRNCDVSRNSWQYLQQWVEQTTPASKHASPVSWIFKLYWMFWKPSVNAGIPGFTFTWGVTCFCLWFMNRKNWRMYIHIRTGGTGQKLFDVGTSLKNAALRRHSWSKVKEIKKGYLRRGKKWSWHLSVCLKEI